MAKNKYLDFISDRDLLECVQWVCDAYPENASEIDMERLHKNTLDPFKLFFDIFNRGDNVEDWLKVENARQIDKKVNNKIGEFHQKLLGKIAGWEDLGIGDLTGLDIKKSDNSIFIELKNKENTVNSSSMAKLFDKLDNGLKKYPNATFYWGFVYSKKGDSGEKVWKYLGKENPKIKLVWGKKLYQFLSKL